MPQSFVNQATGRCSVEGAKLWFSCNPNSRRHYFKLEWINRYKDKRLLYLHFTMDDNYSLSERTKERYRSMYSGVFYRRYILGEWVSADGLIYDMWDDDQNTFTLNEELKQRLKSCTRYIAVDYGTVNPMVFLDCYDDGKTIYIANEYYYDSRANMGRRQKTDSEYANDFDNFVGRDRSVTVVMDPSAVSFRTELRNRGYHVREANNDVIDGIRRVSTMILKRYLKVEKKCSAFLREVSGYIWDEKAILHGEEKPVKVGDHAMDATRYLINTVVSKNRMIL